MQADADMPAITNERAVPIGEASRRTGVNIETIRYYERIGLMPKPDRSAGGSRLFDRVAVDRLAFIRRCRELGFGIGEIGELLQMVDRRDFTCGEVHRITVEHLDDVRGKIASLMRLASVLEEMASRCSRGETPECAVIDVLREERDRHD
jgi:MerR family transcriptional regulator, mercuric resistance operon regulatory protein